MTASSFLRDFTAFSVQIALVGLGIALLLKLVKLPAGVRYTGLRLALVASLVVPWLLRAPAVEAPAPAASAMPAGFQAWLPTTDAFTTSSTDLTPLATRSRPIVPWVQVGFGALLIGIAARVVWLGMGVLRLLRLKRAGVAVDAPEYAELQQQLGTRATIAEVAALPQPATFGVRRPIVLLPDTLAAASSSLRRAVVAHELFHVRRRDWLSVLAEEAVRTALWFHPAILWMTSQIQLAREEIVDELTVQATGDRRTYVEALIAFADTPGLSTAPAFAHRRQLFHRILSVSKEKAMSRPRILSSAVVLLAAVAGASWYASTLFPIVKAAKVEEQAPARAALVTTQNAPGFVLDGDVVVRGGEFVIGAQSAVVTLAQRSSDTRAVTTVQTVTPENPIPRRTRGVVPARPSRFADAHVVISPLVTLDRNGAVMSVEPDACEVSGLRTSTREDVCDAFFEPTAAAIRQWRYERPAQGPIQFYVHVRYQPGAEPTVTQSAESYKAYVRDTQESQRVMAEARTVEQERYLRAQAEALIARSREIERAQRLTERGLLANPNPAALQADLERLNAEIARVEAQLRNARVQDRVSDQARVEEQLRAARTSLDDQRRLEAEYRASLAQSARAAAEAQAAADQLREAARRLDRSNREPEQATSAEVSREPASTNNGSRPLVSPSGRAPVQALGANGARIPGLQMPVVTKSPKPEYPPEAKEARLQGTVVLEALVDERGRVADARVRRGVAQLDQAALDTAKQWEFKPATLNGEAVPVIVVLEMEFNLR